VATQVQIAPHALRQIAQMGQSTEHLNPHDGAVAVVGLRDIAYGLSRMWEAYVAERLARIGWQTRTFRKPDAAIEWLRETLRKAHGLEISLDPAQYASHAGDGPPSSPTAPSP